MPKYLSWASIIEAFASGELDTERYRLVVGVYRSRIEYIGDGEMLGKDDPHDFVAAGGIFDMGLICEAVGIPVRVEDDVVRLSPTPIKPSPA